jgi:FAD/FMN-containing dehydrogenase
MSQSGDLESQLQRLRSRLAGDLVLPDDAEFEAARSLWNGMIDLRPAAIARCTNASDVAAAVTTARETGLPLAVRSGGHNVAGLASVADGLVIDLSAMNEVTVDADQRLVTAGGGALLADLDAAAQRHGLAVPAGVVSATGVGGLTLSGGLGWLRRRHGLTCDNLVAAELVTADGEIRQVDAESDPELLWGLRGGGGNFGVVTRFTYSAHPIGPDVAFLFCLYPIEHARVVLEAHERLVLDSDDISTIAVLGVVPAVDDFADDIHGAPYVGVLGMYAGTAADGEAALAPLRGLAPVLADLSGPMSYVDAQQVYDADYPDGHRYYWKSTGLSALTDDTVDVLVAQALAAPSPESTIDIWLNGGAMARVDDDATAYSGRDTRYLINPEANWEHPSDDEANVAWARGVLTALDGVGDGRAYLNFPGFLEEGDDLVRRSLGPNYDRLAQLKARVDPGNLFRRNANIPPAIG